eukprot:symbB.v1.2.015028.t1/scaffold1113.1/size137147/12
MRPAMTSGRWWPHQKVVEPTNCSRGEKRRVPRRKQRRPTLKMNPRRESKSRISRRNTLRPVSLKTWKKSSRDKQWVWCLQKSSKPSVKRLMT